MIKKRSYVFCLLAIAITILVVIAGFAGCKKKDKVKYDDTYEMTLREGCSDFYYSHLSENQQKMYRMLYKEAEDVLYNGQEKDTLGTYKFSEYGLSYDEAVTVWYAFRYDAPAFFIISNSYSYNRSSLTVKIAPEFTDKGVREKVLKSIENSVDEVRQMLDGIEASAMKFKVIYDYVMEHTEYSIDYGTSINNRHAVFDGYTYSIAGALDGDNRTNSICQGYVEAISYLCNLFGVECLYVGCETQDHAVNIVKLDGEWYYVDATLDDTTDEYKYFLNGNDFRWRQLSQPYGNSSLDYFLTLLPELDDYEYWHSMSNKLCRNGDFYYSISKMRGEYTCSITSCVDTLERVEYIPTNVGIYEVTYFELGDCTNLKSVKVQDGHTVSGSFAGCVNLTSVELPQSVTTISSWAFYNCSSLKSIEIPSRESISDLHPTISY